MTATLSPAPLTLLAIRRLADQHKVPVEDVLLIAINLLGIASAHGRHRARVAIRLASRPEVPWMVIVPPNAMASPFLLRGDELTLAGSSIGTVERVAADEAVGGYFRDNGRAATLNPNARSRCAGCAFCPNTLEAAADPRLAEERQLTELLAAMTEQHSLRSLAELREITVSTGCFDREQAAVDHLTGLREALKVHGIGARIGFLTSVIRSSAALEELVEHVEPFVLRLTVGCFSRRDLLLKASKAILTTSVMPQVPRRAMQAGHGTSFTYIVGLDAFSELRRGVAVLMPFTTEFLNSQYELTDHGLAGLSDRKLALLTCEQGVQQGDPRFVVGQLPPAFWCLSHALPASPGDLRGLSESLDVQASGDDGVDHVVEPVHPLEEVRGTLEGRPVCVCVRRLALDGAVGQIVVPDREMGGMVVVAHAVGAVAGVRPGTQSVEERMELGNVEPATGP